MMEDTHLAAMDQSDLYPIYVVDRDAFIAGTQRALRQLIARAGIASSVDSDSQ
jgi:hypothetical protein